MNKRWFCEVNENGTGIKVFKGRMFQGIYKFITTDYCRICGEIGVKTENCPWHKEVYEYKRLYLIGKYYTEKVPEDELLTKHINEFKTKREYAFP